MISESRLKTLDSSSIPGNFSAIQLFVKPRCTTVVAALALIGVSVPGIAQFNDIELNGAKIEPSEFQTYKDNNLTERECYPYTDQLALRRVISTRLLDQAGSNAINPQQLASAEPETLYMQLISENNALIVDVAMVRTAAMAFTNRIDAEEALERAQTGEDFDAIASSLDQSGADYELKKQDWQHAGTLAKTVDQQPIAEGALLNTWFDGVNWQVMQVLEVVNKPVVLLDDIIMNPDESVQSVIHSVAINNHKQALVKRLWETSTVSVSGEPLAYYDESDCGYPELELIRKL